MPISSLPRCQVQSDWIGDVGLAVGGGKKHHDQEKMIGVLVLWFESGGDSLRD